MSQMDLSGFGKKFDTSSLFGSLANRAEECGANWDITRLHYTHCALLNVSTPGTCNLAYITRLLCTHTALLDVPTLGST